MKGFFIPVIIIFFFNISSSFASEFVLSKKEDLNGDGKIEEIIVTNLKENPGFMLKVDDVSIKDKFNDEYEETDGFKIVDIERKHAFFLSRLIKQTFGKTSSSPESEISLQLYVTVDLRVIRIPCTL